jgi:hypothetical protein
MESADDWLVYVAVLFALAGAGLLLAAALNNRSTWWETTAWRYRNPEAAEPSEDLLSMGRAVYRFFAVACFGIAAFFGIVYTCTQVAGQVTVPIVPTVQKTADALRADGDFDVRHTMFPSLVDPARSVERHLESDHIWYQEQLAITETRVSDDDRTLTFEIHGVNDDDNERGACLTVTGVGEIQQRQMQNPFVEGAATLHYSRIETTVTEGDC